MVNGEEFDDPESLQDAIENAFPVIHLVLRREKGQMPDNGNIFSVSIKN